MSGKSNCLAAARTGFHSVVTPIAYNGEATLTVNLIDLSTGRLSEELLATLMSNMRCQEMILEYYSVDAFNNDRKLRCGVLSDPKIVDGMLTATLKIQGRKAGQLKESLLETGVIQIAVKGLYKFIRAKTIEYTAITGFRFVFDGSWISMGREG